MTADALRIYRRDWMRKFRIAKRLEKRPARERPDWACPNVAVFVRRAQDGVR